MDHKSNLPRGRGAYLLPNLFTLTALFAGFYAIVMGMANHFDNAAIAIFIAMIMDALDGRVARLTNTQTAFGAQLDSLSDMVSFGMAPALVIYHWGLDSLGKFGWLAAFVYAVAGALRLARFNVQTGSTDKRYFIGLPIPSAAAIVASIVWVGTDYNINGHTFSILIAVITVLIGILMVSRIRYHSFKDINLKNRVPFIAILAVVVILVLIAIDPPEMLLLTFTIYAISGPILWLWRRYRLYKVRKIKKSL